jgi:hypothetical protein
MTMLSAKNSRHVWLVRLCTVTAFVLSLGWAHSAFAAVPMCGSHGQTVAAPPIGTPANDAAVSPCAEDSAPLRAAGVPSHESHKELSFPEQPTRALPVLPRFGPCPVGARLSTAAAEYDVLATGFARSIDRPPRF